MMRSVMLGLFLLLMINIAKGHQDDIFKNKIIRSFGKQTNLRVRRDPHTHHLVDHIMEEIHKGHVTNEKIAHWTHEIRDALAKGEMTMEEYHHLMNLLKESESHESDSCCILG